MDPSPEVRIKCYRLYLQKAIKRLETLGIEYISSGKEKKAAEFDDNIKNITQFSFNIVGYFTDFHTYTIDITDSKTTLTVEYFNNSEQYPIEKNIFLEDLKDLYMGEWKNSYYSEKLIEDGCQWQIFIKYKNKKFLNYDGDNKYPYNFDDLLDCIKKWLPDKEADKNYLKCNDYSSRTSSSVRNFLY